MLIEMRHRIAQSDDTCLARTTMLGQPLCHPFGVSDTLLQRVTWEILDSRKSWLTVWPKNK